MNANPFPVEAVSTYPGQPSTIEFSYMRPIKHELDQYLKAYQLDAERYGGSIGIRGGHGAGKTHLLSWIARTAAESKTSGAVAMYAKADTDRIFDLYRLAISGFGYEALVEIYRKALMRLASQQVRSAASTESVDLRINRPEDLLPLYAEGNLDAERLATRLEERMKAIDVPSDIVKMVLLLGNEGLGRTAFKWLLGDAGIDTASIGVVSSLAEVRVEGSDAAPMEMAAINAFEAIAAVFAISGTPLIVLIDQLEVLFGTENADRLVTLNSLIKKLTEQVQRQSVMFFMTGTDSAWRKINRDVFHRQRIREPYQAGNLSRVEIEALLKAYGVSDFPQDALATLTDVSGGSPREALRTCYFLYDKLQGTVPTPVDVLQASASSGSIEDHASLVLSTLETLAPRHGEFRRDFRVRDGVRLDGLFIDTNVPFAGVEVMRASDKLTEADSAQRIAPYAQALREAFPTAALLVVTVGYSSEEVRSLLSSSAVVVPFSETTFYADADSALTTMRLHAAAQPSSGTSNQPAQSDGKVMAALEKLQLQLNQLEASRRAEATKTDQRFATETAKVSASEVELRISKTRWQLLDDLTRLQRLLEAGDVEAERQQIMAVLVGNESGPRDVSVEKLGGAYVELVNAEVVAPPPALVSEYGTPQYDANSSRKSFMLRLTLIARMNRALRKQKTPLQHIAERLSITAATAAAIIFATCVLFVFVTLPTFVIREYFWTAYFPGILVIAAAGGALVYFIVPALSPLRILSRRAESIASERREELFATPETTIADVLRSKPE